MTAKANGAGCSDVGLDSKKKAGPQVLHQSSRIKHNPLCVSKKVVPRVRTNNSRKGLCHISRKGLCLSYFYFYFCRYGGAVSTQITLTVRSRFFSCFAAFQFYKARQLHKTSGYGIFCRGLRLASHAQEK